MHRFEFIQFSNFNIFHDQKLKAIVEKLSTQTSIASALSHPSKTSL